MSKKIDIIGLLRVLLDESLIVMYILRNTTGDPGQGIAGAVAQAHSGSI